MLTRRPPLPPTVSFSRLVHKVALVEGSLMDSGQTIWLTGFFRSLFNTFVGDILQSKVPGII